jgi:lipopolysaccharide export system protein LptC
VRSRANTFLSLGLAAGLAALTFWLERAVQAPASAASAGAPHEPDFIVDRVVATALDKAGKAESELTAQKMTHYPDNETTELEEPRLVQLRDQGPPLRIRAERGTVTKDGEEVRLYGNVRLVREASGTRPELRVETPFLLVFPKEEVARTPDSVVITEGRSRLSGVGMEYNHQTRAIELHGRVSGTFSPVKG